MILATASACVDKYNMREMNPPVAQKKPIQLIHHGVTREDPWYWLRERENPEVISYLEAENAYTRSKIPKEFEDMLFEEIVSRIRQEDMSVPYLYRGYNYYTRYREGQEYPVYCRRKGSMESDEEIMLDVNIMAGGHSYFHVGDRSVSPDNRWLAYGVDTMGRRKYTLHIKDLITGEVLEDNIPMTTGSACWADDSRTLFYTRKQEQTLRGSQILRHTLDRDEDILVWHEKDETFSTYVYKTRSERYIVIGSSSTLSDEFRFLEANNPTGEFRVFQSREKGLEYSIDHHGDVFYLRTNLDAPNFRLMQTPVTSPSKENWKEIIPHREDVYLNDLELFNDYLVVSERKEGITNLRVLTQRNGGEHYLDFGEEVYVAGICVNPRFDTELLRFNYTSLTTPRSTFDYNMRTREKTLLKEEEIVGNFNKDNYITRRIHATAGGKGEIPVSLVYRKGFQQNGSHHCLLYAYGSYGHTIEPSFQSQRLSLIDRGFIFAIAHIRGGQINGRQWYEDGKLFNKMNTFTDFNDCAAFLINEKFTSPDRMFAMGGSAGGLLMGAVVNLKPELYRGVVAAVPFVDVVTTMLDEEIPLTTSEYDEWGDPSREADFRYMLGYSPYDNVEEKDYPAILVTAGLHDSQVQYWEPAKWVAKLRDRKTDDNLLLLHTNMDTGHGGASGRFEYYRETAMEYSFILKLAGQEE